MNKVDSLFVRIAVLIVCLGLFILIWRLAPETKVSAYPATMENIALGKPVVVYENDEPEDAHLIVDGNNNTAWRPGRQLRQNPNPSATAIIIDLQAHYQINNINVVVWMDDPGSDAHEFQLGYGDQNTLWDDIPAPSGYMENWHTHTVPSNQINQTRKYRYVRLRTHTNYYWEGWKEVRVNVETQVPNTPTFTPTATATLEDEGYRYWMFVAHGSYGGANVTVIPEIFIRDSEGNIVTNTGWTVTTNSAHSQHPASDAVDGQRVGYWHTYWTPLQDSGPHPHHIVIDMLRKVKVASIVYVPRQEIETGRVSGYEFLAGSSPGTWTRVASGTFQNTTADQHVTLNVSYSTPTPTPTNTPTSTSTWTATSTPTATSTHTSTPIPTTTLTRTTTPSPTNTTRPTSTATWTRSSTSTPTGTQVRVNTATPTSTATIVKQNTVTPTSTPTTTIVAQNTATPTKTPTTTPTAITAKGTLSGLVWVDANQDGLYQQSTEAPLSGVSYAVYVTGQEAQSSRCSSGTTEQDGWFHCSITAGDYIVDFTAPTGYVFTDQNQGAYEFLDSDVDPEGRTAAITVSAGQVSNTLAHAGVVLAESDDLNPGVVESDMNNFLFLPFVVE
ncbi:MAG: discoidin domain-containing protein [Chloroflexota bacterium]